MQILLLEIMQLRPLHIRAKPIDDIYLWTAAKEENVQNFIKMQTELDVTLNKFYLRQEKRKIKNAQEAVI